MTGGSAGIEQALHAIEQYPLPVVAVVNGNAIAGGAELAIHCDIVVASTEARIGMSLAQIGLAPPWPLAAKLLDVAGPNLAPRALFPSPAPPAGPPAGRGGVRPAPPPRPAGGGAPPGELPPPR